MNRSPFFLVCLAVFSLHLLTNTLCADTEDLFRSTLKRNGFEDEEIKVWDEQFKTPLKVEIGDAPIRGNKKAQISIVMFSDYACPYCAEANKDFIKLVDEYKGNVNFAHKNFPLDSNPYSKLAAKIALTAKSQGKFWEVNDSLYSKQKEFSSKNLLDILETLGLDLQRFQSDYKTNFKKNNDSIARDKAQGEALGVEGTPSIFINGVYAGGARDILVYRAIIDKWLSTANKGYS